MAPRRKRDAMAPKINTKSIERSFKGLRDALFEEFEMLRSNKTKPERANAAARLASEITKSVSAQCELLRLSSVQDDQKSIESVKGLLL
jgi:hypothetical protein